MGYHRAGWEVVGVDIKPQPYYPFRFHQADAMTFSLDGFDAIHASPPCQRFTRAARLGLSRGYKVSDIDLIPETRCRLMLAGVPYIIENVEEAPLHGVVLCGSSFGLGVRRHRIFESNRILFSLPCRHQEQGRPIGVYHRMKDTIPHGGRTARTIEEAQVAMGIDWVPEWNLLKECIPPAYTEHLGKQIITCQEPRETAQGFSGCGCFGETFYAEHS